MEADGGEANVYSLGTCPKAQMCRYIHDASKVAVCRDFLLTGTCPSGESCDLSHELIPARIPHCLHFAKGTCSKEDCPYAHVRVASSATVCRAFAIYGFCELGSRCTEKHVYECPDFSNTGSCKIKGCKLPHRIKASVLRKKVDVEEDSDISSDEEDEAIDSDDVDSDEIEEFFGDDDGVVDSDIAEQKDFVPMQ